MKRALIRFFLPKIVPSTLVITLVLISYLTSVSLLGKKSIDIPFNISTGSTENVKSCSNSFERTSCHDTCREHEGCFSTLFLPRPQGLYTPAFLNPYWFPPVSSLLSQPCSVHDDDDYNYSSNCPLLGSFFTLGYRYNQTMHEQRISRCLFGSDTLSFTGSTVPNRKDFELIADFFGLPTTYKGRVTFHPRIRNHIVDALWLFSLDGSYPCFENSYIQINTSLVTSSWDLHGCQSTQQAQNAHDTLFPTCYQSSNANKAQTTDDLRRALAGDFLFGDMNEPWHYGRFTLDKTQSKTALANIDLLLGYNIWQCPAYHAGLFIKASAPTGNRPESEFVFEPIIGNGHHWEFGGGFDAHYILCSYHDRQVGFYLNGAVTHLFTDTQWRTFDLKPINNQSGCLSRYLLLKEFAANNQYTGRLSNAVNFTTRHIDSKFNIQGEATLQLLYRDSCWAAGFGYNVYGRSEEKIDRISQGCHADRSFGVKGTLGACARELKNNILTDTTERLTSTQNNARITIVQTDTDNGVNLVDPSTDTIFITWDSPTTKNNLIIAQESRVRTQLSPVLLSSKNLAIKGIPSQLVHTIFAHINYQWEQWETVWYQPWFGLGGGVDFAHQGSCHVCTPSSWTLWVKTGLNF